MRPVISIPRSAPSIPSRLFCLYSAVKWNCDAYTLPASSPFLFLSFSFITLHRSFLARSFPLSAHLSFSYPSAHPKLNAFAVLASLPRSPFVSFPTVFLPRPCPKRLNPTSPLPSSSFSSATLPSLPHLLFSYQPGRTRIHILQAFMMAAAHLCKPACWAASSLPRAGSPLSNQSDTGSAQANPCALSLFLLSTTVLHYLDAL